MARKQKTATQMLLDELKKEGIGKAELARYSGVARSTIEAWAAGTSEPKPATLQKIARGLYKRASRLYELAFDIGGVVE